MKRLFSRLWDPHRRHPGSMVSPMQPAAPSNTGSQPIQQRFGKFTLPARAVLIVSAQEARQFGTNRLGPEHLLLALTHSDCGMPSAVLRPLGVSRGTLLTVLRPLIHPASSSYEDISTLTPQARQVIQLSIEEARMRAMRYIAPEHILLGVMRVLAQHPNEPLNDALHRLNADPGKLERHIQMAFDHQRRFARPPILPG